MLLLLITAGAWVLLQRSRFLPAGVLIGLLVAIKPNFLVWPALLLLAGYWLPAVVAIAAALLVSLVPAILHGPGIYLDWYTVHQTYYTSERIGWPVNTSLIGLATRYDLPAMGYVSAFLLLASPIAWVSYTVLLIPLFVRRRWSPLLVASAVLLAVPSWLVWSVPALGLYYNLSLLPLPPIAIRAPRLTTTIAPQPLWAADREGEFPSEMEALPGEEWSFGDDHPRAVPFSGYHAAGAENPAEDRPGDPRARQHFDHI